MYLNGATNVRASLKIDTAQGENGVLGFRSKGSGSLSTYLVRHSGTWFRIRYFPNYQKITVAVSYRRAASSGQKTNQSLTFTIVDAPYNSMELSRRQTEESMALGRNTKVSLAVCALWCLMAFVGKPEAFEYKGTTSSGFLRIVCS